MLIPILSVALAVLAGLFLMMVMIASRRAGRIDSLETELDQLRARAQDAEAKIKDKTRQIDELRSKLNKAKDETKRAKKKAYEKTSVQPDTGSHSGKEDKELEKQLTEARAEIKLLKQKLHQQEEQSKEALEQADKLKSKVAELKTKLEELENELIKAGKGETDRVVKAEKRAKELDKKLEVANRRLRTDAQVYRVTNSKLELAMEKISELQKRLDRAEKIPDGKNEKVSTKEQESKSH